MLSKKLAQVEEQSAGSIAKLQTEKDALAQRLSQEKKDYDKLKSLTESLERNLAERQREAAESVREKEAMVVTVEKVEGEKGCCSNHVVDFTFLAAKALEEALQVRSKFAGVESELLGERETSRKLQAALEKEKKAAKAKEVGRHVPCWILSDVTGSPFTQEKLEASVNSLKAQLSSAVQKSKVLVWVGSLHEKCSCFDFQEEIEKYKKLNETTQRELAEEKAAAKSLLSSAKDLQTLVESAERQLHDERSKFEKLKKISDGLTKKVAESQKVADAKSDEVEKLQKALGEKEVEVEEERRAATQMKATVEMMSASGDGMRSLADAAERQLNEERSEAEKLRRNFEKLENELRGSLEAGSRAAEVLESSRLEAEQCRLKYASMERQVAFVFPCRCGLVPLNLVCCFVFGGEGWG